jgi:hypothetical protein
MKQLRHKGLPPPGSAGEPIRLSFRYLETAHPLFGIGRCGSSYFRLLLARLKELSELRPGEFRTHRSHALRLHRIEFNDPRVAARSFGVPGRPEVDRDAWQFSLSANEHGRVHGFLLEDTFYVRWLDPDHNLYSN